MKEKLPSCIYISVRISYHFQICLLEAITVCTSSYGCVIVSNRVAVIGICVLNLLNLLV